MESPDASVNPADGKVIAHGLRRASSDLRQERFTIDIGRDLATCSSDHGRNNIHR